MGLFWRGLLIGFSVAAPVGPIGLLCIRRTLVQGRWSGFASGMGAAAADFIYGCGGPSGTAAVSNLRLAYQVYLRLFGGLYLPYPGFTSFRQAPPASPVRGN